MYSLWHGKRINLIDTVLPFHRIGGCRGGPGGPGPPLGSKFFQVSCSFRQKIEKIIPILEVGAPPWGKSWIRHCMIAKHTSDLSVNNFIMVVMLWTENSDCTEKNLIDNHLKLFMVLVISVLFLQRE